MSDDCEVPWCGRSSNHYRDWTGDTVAPPRPSFDVSRHHHPIRERSIWTLGGPGCPGFVLSLTLQFSSQFLNWLTSRKEPGHCCDTRASRTGLDYDFVQLNPDPAPRLRSAISI